jgi:hypothetical protein
MNNQHDQSADLGQSDEDIFTSKVSDEALEAAAGVIQENFHANTWSSMGFATNCILSCCN